MMRSPSHSMIKVAWPMQVTLQFMKVRIMPTGTLACNQKKSILFPADMTFKSAEQVVTKGGKQYHIGLKPGDLASTILMCGDPARVHKVAQFLTDLKEPIVHRDYLTISGKYNGIPVSVMATGMGPDNTEIAVVEISQLIQGATLIRIGSCGGLQEDMNIGDLVISTGAMRLENTTSFFVPESYPAVPHYEVTQALIRGAEKGGFKHHIGITATAPGFYGAQARKVPGFPLQDPDLPEKLATMKVMNFEMEASALFVLGQLAGFRTGCVCAIYASRKKNEFISEEMMEKAQHDCIVTGLNAIHILEEAKK